MATAQNIIHSSSFNFEYETKDSARRGNELIESIFDSQILPELEKAVAKKLPSEVRIELSKLEINIGTISEKELPVNLAARIRESLENALTFNIGQKLNGKGIASEGQKPDNFLIQSLEIFLLKGYFPFAMEKFLTFDELVKRILQRNQEGLSEVLFRHRNREQAIQRIVNNLGTETFDELLTAQEPVNTKWIIEFREFLMKLKKELNLNQYSDSEFLKLMNASILKFTLNETSLTFSKEKFSTNIVRWFMDVLDPDINLIAEVILRNKGTDPILMMAESSLKQL
ncbi:contractile injection system tape measure protein, partial [Mariniphaga sp.]|uniref:contractile injection system tape measure protein n=1 Tax=Mariniphaga sp. TaxID=1954475 RepID=UPI0035679DC1